MTTFISGLFDNRVNAQNALDGLVSLGVSRDEISLLAGEQARGKFFGEAAALYGTGLRSGNLFVGAHVPSTLTDEALDIFSTQGAHDVYTRYDDTPVTK